MSFENYSQAESFTSEQIIKLFDDIPQEIVSLIDRQTNKHGLSLEVLRNSIEYALTEEPGKLKRLGELLLVLSESDLKSDAEKELIPEKIEELITLVN